MNAVELSATSKHPFTGHYPESSMHTMDYGQGHSRRKEVTMYINNNPFLRTIGKRRPSKITFFEKDSVLLNITECDFQLYDTYLEQWIISVKRDYQSKHELGIEAGEAMIQIGEN